MKTPVNAFKQLLDVGAQTLLVPVENQNVTSWLWGRSF